MPANPHPLLASLAARHGLASAIGPGGHAALVIDERYRVRLAPGAEGGLVLTAALCELPAGQPAREALAAELGRQALGLLAGHACACVIDPAGTRLCLQQCLPADSTDLDVDEALGDFANALSFWTAAVRQAASRHSIQETLS